MTIGLFRKKPVQVEAVQLSWRNWSSICELVGDVISGENPGRMADTYSDTCGEESPYIELTIPTLEGDHVARHGDWIIKGTRGEIYPCKPGPFEDTFEQIGEIAFVESKPPVKLNPEVDCGA